MRKSSVFWAIVLIVVGLLWLLDNLGAFRFLGVSVWGLIWPAVLILLGIWILAGIGRGGRRIGVEQATIPLDGAARARIRMHHGAGRLSLQAGAEGDRLLAGTFGGGLDYRTRQEGGQLVVDMRPRSRAWTFWGAPWAWSVPGSLDWTMIVNPGIALELDLETGANDTRLDLSELLVTDLRLKTGASATQVTLPARAGHTRVRAESGAASVTIRVPEGVAARIRVEGALAGVDVDTHRFPRMGGIYQSVDYETAQNRADIRVEAAVGSVTVR